MEKENLNSKYMKNNQLSKKNISPSKYQIKKVFTAIKDFQKNNVKYLLLPTNKIVNKSSPVNIFTTTNTNI